MKNQYSKFTKRTLGVAGVVVTVALAAGCGGGAKDPIAELATAIGVSSGNSPFIGVKMKAVCANEWAITT